MENRENKKLTRKEKRALKKRNKKTADRKGILLVVALSVIAVALMYNAVKVYTAEHEFDKLVINYNVAPMQIVPTTQIQPEVTQPTQSLTTTAPTENQQPTTLTQPEVNENKNDELSEADILKKVGDGINYIKDLKGTVQVKKTQIIDLTLTECSLPAFVGIVNKVLDFFAGETVTEYTFTDGKATDDKGNEVTFYGALPPANRYFELTQEGMADARVTKDGENTVYTVVVVPETSTMANPRPPFHSSAGDTFDCTKVELPIGQITKADFDYPGSEISITVAPDGKIIRYHQTLKINGVGGGAALGMSADGRIEGEANESWEFTY